MVNSAERFKEQDEAMRKCVDAKASLEAFVYGARNAYKGADGGESTPEKEAAWKEAEPIVMDAIAWLDGHDANSTPVEEFEKKKKEVEEKLNPITAKMYQAAGGAGAGAPPSEPIVDEVD
jgi:L1 cell adhesion molecule like protein